MSRNGVIAITTAMTVFVIALSGVLAWKVQALNHPSKAGTTSLSQGVVAEASPPPQADQTLVQQLLKREQEYRQRIEQANEQLRRAYDQIAQLQSALSHLQAQSTASAPPQTNAPQATSQTPQNDALITPQDAVAIALAYLGGGRVQEVELEDEHGVVAYKVKVDGHTVGVDAFTGEVLFHKAPRRAPLGNFPFSIGKPFPDDDHRERDGRRSGGIDTQDASTVVGKGSTIPTFGAEPSPKGFGKSSYNKDEHEEKRHGEEED
ncbi:hypothetical protein HRbin23_00412 [bacterium HR23]|nr:hypothetical protein HRbin23_00412 [bacterium HR23]